MKITVVTDIVGCKWFITHRGRVIREGWALTRNQAWDKALLAEKKMQIFLKKS